MTKSVQTTIPRNSRKALGLSQNRTKRWAIYMQSYPRSGGSQGQETFLAPSADKKSICKLEPPFLSEWQIKLPQSVAYDQRFHLYWEISTAKISWYENIVTQLRQQLFSLPQWDLVLNKSTRFSTAVFLFKRKHL